MAQSWARRATVTAAAAVIWTAPLTTRLLAAPAYHAAWRYVPVRTLVTAFASMSAFLSSVYMAARRSAPVLATTLLGAVLNLAGNLLLIPRWGSMGAAVSTLASYVLMFAVRAVHTRRLLRLRWHVLRLAASRLLLAVECLLLEWEVPGWPGWCGACLLAVAAVNGGPLRSALRRAR